MKKGENSDFFLPRISTGPQSSSFVEFRRSELFSTSRDKVLLNVYCIFHAVRLTMPQLLTFTERSLYFAAWKTIKLLVIFPDYKASE
ncbi:hypothetical protein [Anaerophaga thermohalophila]|uniref:hypothetical protein n=1 Tax=Anaerophaga thermohalophila TaxID=177400 RepID=UPI00111244E9|nr:hypothetical protein [Anaerophaga thermohalophila]